MAIRLIEYGEEGQEELKILQAVAAGVDAFDGRNHVLPMIHTLSTGPLTFGVFPLMVKERFGTVPLEYRDLCGWIASSLGLKTSEKSTP